MSFGGAKATGYTVNSSTQITATAPAGLGTVDIRVTTPDGISVPSAASQYTYVAAPTVTSVSPSAGRSLGGTTVVITGTGFSGATAVTFGGTPATGYTVFSSTQIMATAPAGMGTVDIRVTTVGGTSATSAADQYTYVAAPTVTSVSPSAGRASGGTTVVITGTNFGDATAVSFGATAATGYTVNSSTQITATAPAGMDKIDIRVTTVGGTSATSAADQYTYLPAPTLTTITPARGPASGGNTVTLLGTNLGDVSEVRFGSAPAIGYIVNSATQITATVPAGSGLVPIQVNTTGGLSAVLMFYVYVDEPSVTSISPSTGPTSGGNAVVITGANLSGAVAVNFGAVAATGYTVNSATQITATAPAQSAGTVNVSVTTAGGTSATSATGHYTYIAGPTVTSISPSAGPVSGGSFVTITGRDFVGTTSVRFGAVTASDFTVDSPSQITATAPAGTGVVDVTVVTPGGTSPASDLSKFAYTASPVSTVVTFNVAYGRTTAFDLRPHVTGPEAVYALVSATSNGSATLLPNGTGTYTPILGAMGADSFVYRATNAGGTVTGTASFNLLGLPTVTSLSVPAGPLAGGNVVTITGQDLGGATSVTFGGVDATIVSNSATHIEVTAPAGVGAVDVVVTTEGGVSLPVAAGRYLYVSAPTVTDATVNVVFDTQTSINLSTLVTAGYDRPLIFKIESDPRGVAVLTNADVSYTPEPGYSGTDTFTWKAIGEGGDSIIGTVYLVVAGPVAPQITEPSAPVAVPSAQGSTTVDLGAVSQGLVDGYRITQAARFGLAEVLNDSVGASSRAAGATASSAPVASKLIYTPAANFMGTDTVTLVAYGPGGESAPVTYTFQVSGTAPALSGQVVAGSSVTVSPTANLVGGPFQAVRITRAPEFGTATVNGLDIVFMPGAAGGTTSLEYVIDLAFGSSAAGRIELASNALPETQALVAEALQGVPVTRRISNVRGGPFTDAAIVSMSPSTAGEATITKVGQDYDLTFVSTGDFAEDVVVTYSLTNAYGSINSTLTVTVEARPDPSKDPEVRGLASGQVNSARRFADAQASNFQRRLQSLHNGTNGSSNGLSVNLGLGAQADADKDPRQSMRRDLGLGRADKMDPGQTGPERSRDLLGTSVRSDDGASAQAQQMASVSSATSSQQQGPFGFWTAGSVDWGRQDATGQRDYRFTTQGVTLGMDRRINDALIFGVGVGYGEDKTKSGDNGSYSNGSATTAAAYVSWKPTHNYYVDGVAGVSSLNFNSRRWTAGMGGEAEAFAQGERSGEARFFSAAIGRINKGDADSRQFYVRVDARTIVLDGFTETGAGHSSLSWDEVEQNSLSANLGASWEGRWASRTFGVLRPSALIEWSHEFEAIGDQGVRYADWATSPTYLVRMDEWSRNNLRLNLGADWNLDDNVLLGVGYRGNFSDVSQSHGGEVRMKFGW